MEKSPPEDDLFSTARTHRRKMSTRRKRFGRSLHKGVSDQKTGKTATTRTTITDAAAAQSTEDTQVNADNRPAARKPTIAEMRSALSKCKKELDTSVEFIEQADKINKKQADQIVRGKRTQKATALLLKQSRDKVKVLEKQISKAEPKLSVKVIVEQNTMLNATVTNLVRNGKVCNEYSYVLLHTIFILILSLPNVSTIAKECADSAEKKLAKDLAAAKRASKGAATKKEKEHKKEVKLVRTAMQKKESKCPIVPEHNILVMDISCSHLLFLTTIGIRKGEES